MPQFQKGNKFGKVKTGRKQKKTLIKEALGINNIEDLKGDVLKVWQALINDRSKSYKAMAAKEISQYIFPKKKEVTKTDKTFEDFLKEIIEGEKKNEN